MPQAPSVGASRMAALRDLWTGAGLESVQTREMTVQRTFADFDDFWRLSTMSGGIRPTLAAMEPRDIKRLRDRVCARLPADAAERITYEARAHAVTHRSVIRATF